jgi:methylthioribose-1-phosphate isomerase
MYYTIKWNKDSVSILDQRLLPIEEVYHTYTSYTDVARAIKDMVTRGAPAIGVTAGMGIALAAKKSQAISLDEFVTEMDNVFRIFAESRPTAVNLFWSIDRMKKIVTREKNINRIKELLEKEAITIYNEDIEINKKMGKNGSRFLKDGDVVLTHCNAGALATAGYGTALGVIRAAIEEGKKISVICCETRPYLQGARLTAWELLKDNIPTTLICDNMAGYLMSKGEINKIIVGADRIAANGDVANKIGTYTHSVLAKEHNIPFYVAAPVSTLDGKTESGSQIPIEERSVDEVAFVKEVQIAPEGVVIRNPAFDVTPAENISAIITEKGVVEHPKDKGITHLL